MSNPAQGAVGAETMTALKHREAKLTEAINEASGWGAAVGAMGEELRSVQRRIAALASPRADSDERTAWEASTAAEHAHFLDLAAARLQADGYPANAASCANAAAFLRATPAQPAGAVPDSLRALSEAAYPGPWIDDEDDIIGTQDADRSWGGGDIICDMPSEGEDSREHWPQNRAFIIAAANFVREQIASHPAGQSAGSGDLSEHSTQEIVRRTRCMADETRDPVVWRDCCDLILERLGKPAPDSTRTGQGEAEGLPSLWEPQSPAEWLEKAERQHRKGMNLGVLHEELPRLIAVFEKALAARPTAPEAQGAWFPISTAPKDGTHVIAHDEHYGVCEAVWRRAFDDLAEETFEGLWDMNHSALNEVTGWQPMPAPPASSGQGGR